MKSIPLRPAGPQDIPAITQIYAHAVRHGTASFELEPPSEAEMMTRQRSLVGGGYPYIVAEIDGCVLGYAYAGPYRMRPAYRWSVEDSVYVTPDACRRGIGRALLQQLVIDAERRGFRQMIAIIGDSNQPASIALHRAVGFHSVGTLTSVGFKHARWLDTVLMQRPLGLGDAAPP
jgi:phosphinothricin acetyltransferase